MAFSVKRLFPDAGDRGVLLRCLPGMLLAALLLWLAFPPLEWALCGWFGLAPFLVVLHGRSLRQGLWLSWIFGFLFFYSNVFWLNTLFSVHPAAPLGILLLGAAMALYLLPFGWLAPQLLERGGWWIWLGLPAVWVTTEFLRVFSELAFPWIFLAHTQAPWPLALQGLDVSGTWGLSFLMVWTNLLVARLWELRCGAPGRWKPLLPALLLVGLGLLSHFAYGFWRMGQYPADTTGETLRVGLVQPGVPQSLKLASYAAPDPGTRVRARAAMHAMTVAGLEELAGEYRGKEGAAKPDLVVLPESAITDTFFNYFEEQRLMAQGWARRVGAPLLFGANHYDTGGRRVDEDRPPLEQGELYNSAWLADPEAGLSPTVYNKMHLVPFGEHASYFGVIPGFSELVLGVGDFHKGRQPAVFEVGGRRLGPLICFESSLPYLFRKVAREGVDVLVVITNDAWYKTSSGARRHQRHAIFRAIESRRPLIRVANTGISCLVDAAGRTLLELPLLEGEPLAANGELPLPPPELRGTNPPAIRAWGDWMGWLCLAMSVAMAAGLWYHGRKNSRSAAAH